MKTFKFQYYSFYSILLMICLSFGSNAILAQALIAPWGHNTGGSNDDRGQGIATDSDNNVYVVGYFRGTNIDFDPSGFTSNFSSIGDSEDIFLVKYNSAGEFQWAKAIGGNSGTDTDRGFGIAVDANGFVYITGRFAGTADFGGTSLVGGDNIFVAKYNGNGDLQWAKGFGGSDTDVGRDIAVDASGNVYLTGQFEGSADFDPDNAGGDETASGQDIFVLKLDDTGTFEWVRTYGSASNDDRGNAIAVDASGNVHVTGQFAASVDFGGGNLSSLFTGIFILKLDTNGNYIWAAAIGGASAFDEGEDIALDASGNVFVTGHFQGTDVDFDPGTGTNLLTSEGDNDAFLLKLNSAGEHQWAQDFTNNTDKDEGHAVAVDQLGNVYITGFLRDKINFGGGDIGSGTTDTQEDIFIAKFDTDGNHLNSFYIESTNAESPQGIAIDTDGNILSVGYFSYSMFSFNINPNGTAINLDSNGSNDFYVLKYFSASPLNLSSSTPGTNTLNIEKDVNIVLNFDANVDQSSIDNGTSANVLDDNILIYGEQSGRIAGTFSGNETKIITFNPTNDFKPGEIIHVIITSEVKSLNTGKAKEQSISFTVKSGVSEVSFDGAEKVIDASNNLANTVGVGDFNNDGFMDVVAGSNDFYWYQGNGTGNFSSRVLIENDSNFDLGHLSVADLDNDGDDDVAIAYQDSGHRGTVWYENVSNGTSWTQHVITSGPPVGLVSIVTTDFDNDGDIDIVTGGSITFTSTNPTLILHENNGGGDFTTISQLNIDTQANLNIAREIAASDLDNDGDLDILVAARGSNALYWYENDGMANFSSKQTIASSKDGTSFVSSADFTGDSRPDVLGAINFDDEVSLYTNALPSPWTETVVANTSIVSVPTIAQEADMDGDGDLDILVGDTPFDDSKILYFENTGTASSPTFSTAPSTLGTTVTYNEFMSVDMDGDGDLDVLFTNEDSDKVAWYENIVLEPAEIKISQGGTEYQSGENAFLSTVSLGTSEVYTFTIENSGEISLNLTGTPDLINLTGTNASEFSITSLPTTPITGSSSTTFEITFIPTSIGTKEIVLSIPTNDADENPFILNLQASSGDPELTLLDADRSNIDADVIGQRIAGIIPNGTSQEITFGILNEGTGTLTVSDISITDDAEGNFSTGTISESIIEPNSVAQFNVGFTPVTQGLKQAKVLIASNDADENPKEITIFAGYELDVQTQAISDTVAALFWTTNVSDGNRYELSGRIVINDTTKSDFQEINNNISAEIDSLVLPIEPNRTYFFRLNLVTSSGLVLPPNNVVGVATSDLTLVLPPTSLEDEWLSQLKVYPNPSEGLFQIEGLPIGKLDYRLRDAQGNLLFYTSSEFIDANLQLDLRNLPSGIYYLELQTNEGNKTLKLLKN